MYHLLNYYHPSTAVFVDDQHAFLSAIKNRLPQESLALFFNDPKSALDTIVNQKLPQLSQHIYEVEIDEINPHNHHETFFQLKLGDVSKMIYNAKRFSEISVVIVDRMMPQLDGISFCRQLKDHPVKKIMLTASKDRKIATDAFNEGIIDFFLLKDSENLIQQLMNAIEKMQKDYFSALTQSSLGNALKVAVPLANDAFLMNFLQNKMLELNAVEFYLLDKHGSVLFITYDGTPITLVISSDETMDSYAEIAEEHDEPSIANVLLKKEKLLFFPREIDCMRPVSEWQHFLFEAIPIPERSNLFYSLIREPHCQPIDIEKIYSQKEYSVKLI